jgi:hypothetical protein
VNQRLLFVSFTAALIALAAGTAIGLSLRHQSKPSYGAPHRQNTASFVLASQWIHRTKSGRIDLRLLSGTMIGASKFPVVVIDHGSASAPETLELNDATDGPLTIVEAAVNGDLTGLLESRHGYFYALEGSYGEFSAGSSFLTEMGRKLDPKHLPALPREGVAVPVSYGAGDKKRAVVLVAQSPRYSWHMLGFLDGYSVSNIWSPTNERPLVDGAGNYVRIDAPARRLERIPDLSSRKRKWNRIYAFGNGNFLPSQACVPWPAKTGVFLGCPVKIQVSRAGVRSTIYKGSTRCGPSCHYQPIFRPVIPSPSGRRLLVGETDVGPWDCSFSTTSFLSVGSHRLAPIRLGNEPYSTWPLGWLDENEALVGAEGPDGECFPPPSGIWAVDPRFPTEPEQVLQTTSTDATIWRSS